MLRPDEFRGRGRFGLSRLRRQKSVPGEKTHEAKDHRRFGHVRCAASGLSKRAGLPRSAGQTRRVFARRRSSGHHGAASVGQNGRGSRTAGHRREPARRSRRHDRRQIGPGRGTRRPYADDGQHKLGADRASDPQECRLHVRIRSRRLPVFRKAPKSWPCIRP